MSAGTHVMLNCFLTMGLPVLWGLYELWALRRARSGGGDRRVEPPVGPKPLPDCLIPKPLAGLGPVPGEPVIPGPARRERVLEDA